MVRDIEEPTQRAKDTSATEFCKYREALKVCVEIYDECARCGVWNVLLVMGIVERCGRMEIGKSGLYTIQRLWQGWRIGSSW